MADFSSSLDQHKVASNCDKTTLLEAQGGHGLWFLTLRTPMKSRLCAKPRSLKTFRVQTKQVGDVLPALKFVWVVLFPP